MSNWIEHDGKGMPVAASDVVDAISSRGRTFEATTASELEWNSQNTSDVIVAYRRSDAPKHERAAA